MSSNYKTEVSIIITRNILVPSWDSQPVLCWPNFQTSTIFEVLLDHFRNLRIDSRLEKFFNNYSGTKTEFSNQDILDFEDNQSLSSLVQPNGQLNGPTNENVPEEFYQSRVETVDHYLINLICPISKSRIMNPSRGKKCDHVSVFCGESFKNSNLKKCPICPKKVKKIVPDDLLNAYLTNDDVLPVVKTETDLKEDRPQAVIWKFKKGKVKFKTIKTVDQLINLLPTHSNDSKHVGARISLTCPISTNPIKWPSRAKDCDHVEVFCASSLVGNPGGVICPFCEKIVRWENLIIDENISKFIANYPNENSCRINKNGKIKLIKKENGTKALAKRPRLESPDDIEIQDVQEKMEITSKVLNKPSEQVIFISIFVKPARINF